jgi:DegV family protein with EDD domain
MDHLMPGMDGIECLKAIRAQKGGLNREVPVIVLTANAGADNKELYRDAGFDDYLLKPVTGPLLETALVHHLPKELVHLTDAEVMSSHMEAGLFRKHSDRLPILVTSESVCDLPKLTTEKLNIPLISYRIFTEEGDFLDGAEVEADGLMDYIAEGHRRISAKEPSVADYVDFFARALTKANQVIHLALSDNIGHGYENACEAATTFDNVTVFNTRLLSGAMGLLVIQGHRLAATEKTVDAVIDKLTVARDKMRFAVMVNTPDFLYHGNHISGRIASFARAFMLHPVVTLKKGKFKVKHLYAGNLEHCWERFIKNELMNFQDMDDKIAMVNYVGLSFEQQQMLEKMIRTHSSFKTLVFQKSSPAISANCGPLAFGLMVSMKK